MKNSLLPALVTGACSGAVAAFAVTLIMNSDPAAVGVETAALAPLTPDQSWPRADSGDPESEARFVDLQMRMALLEERLATTTRVALDPQAAPQEAADDKELRTFVASLRSSGDDLPPSLKTGVMNALETIRADEELERELERQARREQRVDNRIAKMATEIGLDNVQTKELGVVMLGMETARDELSRSKDKASKEAYRGLRKDYDQSLQQILSPAQYEAFKDLRKDGDERDRGERDRGRKSGADRKQESTAKNKK